MGRSSDKATIQRFAREAVALRSLNLHSVVELFDEGHTSEGVPYLAIEMVEGPSLAQAMIRATRPAAFDTFATTLLNLVDVVAQLHGAGWVHCDLKPENILLTPSRGVKLVDFGLAMPAGTFLDASGKLEGTVESMSPEQCTPGARIDEKSDVYALGVLLYELAFGRPPFSGAPEAVRYAHRNERVRGLHPRRDFDRLLHACLAKDPGDRPTATALRDALPEAWAGDVHETVRASGQRPQRNGLDAVAVRHEAVAALFFSTQRSTDGLLSVLEDEGGKIVEVHEDRRVVAFLAGERDNPAVVALRVAERLHRKELTQAVIVDVVDARVRGRAGRAPRVSSETFRDGRRFPASGLPSGVYVSSEARDRLVSLHLEPAGAGKLWRVAALDMIGPRSTPSDRMFGRAAEMQAALAAAGEVHAGHPGVCRIVGESGIGKTRILHEIETQLLRRGGWSVVRVAPADIMAGHATDCIARIVGELCGVGRELTSEDDAELFAWLGEDLSASHGLGLSFALGWIGPEDPRVAKFKTAPGALQSMASVALGECLRHASRLRPTAILVDNAHAADSSLVAALEFATRPENSGHLWVCVAGKTSALEALHRRGWAAGAPSSHAVELTGLSDDDAGALVAALLSPITHPPIWVIEQIARRAGGHPLLLRELVDGLKRAGLIRPNERGEGFVLHTEVLDDVPALPLVDWLVSREVERLTPELRIFASLAAAMGPEFDGESFIGVVAAFEEDGRMLPFRLEPSVGLLRLVGADILKRRGTRYSFRHEALQKRLERGLAPTLRVAWHRAAYAFFEHPAVGAVARGCEPLAYHASHAGMPDEARARYLELAAAAEARHAYADAEAYYGRALDYCPGPDPDCLRAWHRRGVLRYRLGQYEQASEALERALKLAIATDDASAEVGILLDSATVWDWREDHPQSASIVARAVARCGGVLTPLLSARLQLARGRTAYRCGGDISGAVTMLLAAAESAEALGEDGYETYVIAALLAAPLMAGLGKVEASRQLFERLIERCNECQDAMHLATAYNNRAALWECLQDDVATMADLHRVVAQSRRYGLTMIEAMALRNLAEVAYVIGRYEDSLSWGSAAITIGRRVSGEGQRLQIALLLRARTLTLLGDFAGAAAAMAEIAEHEIQSAANGRTDATLWPADALLRRMVGLFLAGEVDPRWCDLVDASQREGMHVETVEILEFWALLSISRGDSVGASVHLRRALDLVEHRPMFLAQRICDRVERLARGQDPWPERTLSSIAGLPTLRGQRAGGMSTGAHLEGRPTQSSL